MLGLVVHIFCTFIFATRVVVCWQKKKKKKKTILTIWIFFLALNDQEEFAWGKLWQIFSQTGEESCRLQNIDVFMPWGIFYFYTGVSVTMDRSYKQTNKKRQKYYSEVTLVLLHYSKHIEDTHFIWTWSYRPFTFITDRLDGLQLLCTA